MTRGDVVTVAAGGGFGGKPRPALIIQADEFGALGTVVVALFTTTLTEAPLIRIRILPESGNGIATESDLMLDILVTVRRSQIGKVIGRFDNQAMSKVDRALFTFLGLAG